MTQDGRFNEDPQRKHISAANSPKLNLNRYHQFNKGELFKGTVHMHISLLRCSAFYPSRLFWCALQSFGGYQPL